MTAGIIKKYLLVSVGTSVYIASGHPTWYFPGVWIKSSIYGIIWPYSYWVKYFQKEPNNIFYNGNWNYYKIINEQHYKKYPMPKMT